MLKCKLCDFEAKSQSSLSKHTWFSHQLRFPDYLINIKYNKEHPLCNCGCGNKTNYEANKADFNLFLSGHHTKREGHWGDLKSEKRVSKIIATRKAKFASGEYDHIIKSIQDTRKDPNFGAKVSKGKKEKPYYFSDEQKKNQSERMMGNKHSQETKDKMSKTAKDKWETGDIGKRKYYTSKLETTFANILDLLEIKYQKLLYAKEIKAFYDFYIPELNLVIEVDGDFWHCNPNSKHAEAKYESQKKNQIRDKEKEQWLKDNGYKLLRFWESDINNNIIGVKKILLENCKKAYSKD